MPPPPEPLRVLLDIPDLDDRDLAYVEEQKYWIATKYGSRAEQVLDTPQFHDWLVAAEPRELLVHGDFRPTEAHHVSGLSLVCATLARTLRARPRYLALVFFCGLHEGDDEDGPWGPDALVRSFAAQLLRQHPLAATEAELALARTGDLGDACRLFVSLARRVPADVTLVCIVDGIIHFEIDRFEDGMLEVLRCLLRLVRDESPDSARVKVLVTSATPTDSVQREFLRYYDDDDEGDSRLIAMEGLPVAGQGFAMGRMGGDLDSEPDLHSDDDR